MVGERVQGRTFGEVADEYDRRRPSYPDDLVTAVIAYAGGPRLDALEVGAGTGKATTLFAAAGLRIHALEPDPAMAGVLRSRCAPFPNVTVTVISFEEYPASKDNNVQSPFDLLMSAQAWHWTDPATRWQRAAEILRPGGSLAIFGNYDLIADNGVRAAFDQVHAEHAPSIDWTDEPYEPDHLWDRLWGSELKEQSAFEQLEAKLFRSVRTQSRQDYLAYLATHSPYRMLSDDARAQVFHVIASILPDPVVSDVDTVLYLARRSMTE
jgi:SAM-dependent methyltransferase